MQTNEGDTRHLRFQTPPGRKIIGDRMKSLRIPHPSKTFRFYQKIHDLSTRRCKAMYVIDHLWLWTDLPQIWLPLPVPLVSSMNCATKTFSPPLSDLHLFGIPNCSTPSRNDFKFDLAVLSVPLSR